MKDIKKKLVDIPIDYYPVPFWSWNDELEPEELQRQIRWMKDNGIGGFFMHARGGLKTQYMSEEWMSCIDACCDEAEKLGMNAWGYDENGWPSGFAGGKLLEDIENRDRYIEYNTGDFDANADVAYLVEEEQLVRVTEKVAEGSYLNLYIRRSVSTVDILNPDVVRKFISLTHEKYKEHFGEAFSKKFKGFFTDEPQFYRAGGTPYSPMTQAYFREHYGEDVLDGLGLLFVKKKGWKTFRYRYWVAMQSLMLDSFAKQIYEWCTDNQVQLTGHYIEENTMGHQVACCGGVMPFYAYMHIPGIDWIIGDTFQEIAPRQVGSVARQMGKKHVLTESFAARGWNSSPEELRRIAGFQYVNGVNFLCHHLLPYSEHGQRKRDHPIHFTPANPWVKESFKDFNDYFTRLGYLLATGEETVKVAMLHPIRSTYFDFQREKEAEEYCIYNLEVGLRTACRTLSSQGVAYDFLDETLLEKHGFVEGTKIGCGECGYDYLVLPHMLTMGCATEKLIRKFVENGGKLLLLGEAPQYLEGEPYEYRYLQSNCTLEDIIGEQPFKVAYTDNELYYAYRLVEGRPFLFIQNASKTETYTQTFRFADGSQSFMALNPVTLETEQLPMTVTVHENEALLLFPIAEQVLQTKELQEVELTFRNAEVSFDNNYLAIDAVRFSKDGENYSEPVYVNTLFQQLLEERYSGKLWLKYEFEIETIPNSLTIMAERDNMTGSKVNGQPFTFTKDWEDDRTFCLADITPLVRLGHNSYEITMDWHQSEDTYYALFGENVTETLKNCIVYESEIEAIYLCGDFGVYSREAFTECGKDYLCGNSFYIGAAPNSISELVTDGFPFFRGRLKLSQNVIFDNKDIMLHVMGTYLTAKIWVNGHNAGELLFERRIDISSFAKEGENQIEVEFTIGNRNLFGPFHLDGTEGFIAPLHFDICDIPKREDGKPNCKLQRFYGKK